MIFSPSSSRTALALIAFPLFGIGQLAAKEKSSMVPLAEVISVAKDALNDYQKQATTDEGNDKNRLPPLASADFDFKTVVDTKGGIGVSLFVFTLGATREKQVTDDLDFVYMPEAKKEGGNLRATDTKRLYKALLDTLTAAANAVAQASSPAVAPGGIPLDLCQLSVTIAFSVTTAVNGGVAIPFQLVTVTGNLGRSNNNVQQVKLTFKVTDKNIAACAAK